MSLQDVWKESLTFFSSKPIEVEISGQAMSADAGLLLIRQFDEKIQFTPQLADALSDPRLEPEHSVLSMLRQRVYGIIAGYEDQNDHHTLRHDPIFQLICSDSPGEHPLTASQPTLSRFENSIDIPSLNRLQDLLVELFIAQFEEPPQRLVFDLDGFDDPTHGQQQLTTYHGYYGQYQYFPLIMTNAETDLIVLVSLRHGTAHASLGADEDLEFLVTRVREKWPQVRIEVRADSGFAVPGFYEVCERLDLKYVIGLGMNARLKARSETLLTEAVWRREQLHQDQRLFMALEYQADTWDRTRSVVIKAECHESGTNRRAVVTNHDQALSDPQSVYEDYTQRGESENRNKELKVDLCGDRLSDHRFLANSFRLYLHAASLNLLILLRTHCRRQASEAVEEPPVSGPPTRVSDLGRVQPCGWRQYVVKVTAEVRVSCRRVLIRLNSQWPHLTLWREVLQQVQRC